MTGKDRAAISKRCVAEKGDGRYDVCTGASPGGTLKSE